MPQITETTETKHLRNSKLYLLFYSIYEISEWSNRIEIEHKRTHENLKTEQKTSQNIQKYVFPSKKLEENVLACPNVLFYHLKVSRLCCTFQPTPSLYIYKGEVKLIVSVQLVCRYCHISRESRLHNR